MTLRKIFIEISGGCFQNAAGVPKGHAVELIDWDNLLGDGAETAHDWQRLAPESRNFIRRRYPEECKKIMSRIGANKPARSSK